MHQINLLNTMQMKKKNQNEPNQMNRKTICTSQTIILMIVAIVVGLGFVVAVVVISIEFSQLHSRSHKVADEEFTSTLRISSTIRTTSTPVTSTSILSKTTPLNTTSIISTTSSVPV